MLKIINLKIHIHNLKVNRLSSKEGKKKKSVSEPSARPEGSFRMRMLYGIGLIHASNFGVRVKTIQLTIRF